MLISRYQSSDNRVSSAEVLLQARGNGMSAHIQFDEVTLMDIRRISDDYSVSPQIQPQDIAEIKAAGFKSVVCNRPDREDPGQPDHETIRKAVEEAGLAFKWVPVISGQMTADNVAEQAVALEELPGPVFAYCRSGTRSANLYAGVQQMKR